MSYERMTGMGGTTTAQKSPCEQQTCPQYYNRETLNVSHVGINGPRFTRMQRDALESRGCSRLCTPENQLITGSGIEYYCCPQGGSGPMEQPPQLFIPGGEAGPGTVLPQQQVSVQRQTNWFDQIPPWQLIVGTGLIVGGVVWFIKGRV